MSDDGPEKPSEVSAQTDAELDRQREEYKKSLPICPYCLEQPFRLGAIPLNLPNGTRHLVYVCHGCKKVVSIVQLVDPPRIQRPAMFFPGERPQ